GAGAVPVEHLDYDYIGKCKDVKYLEKILRVLRSGSEGIYPHLIDFCESHLEKLEPRSRALRKENPVASVASLSKAERSQIVDELTVQETKKAEISQKQQSLFDDLVKESVPPIRGSNRSTSAPRGKRNSSKQPLPRDYQEWDKFDVEKECERIDGNVINNDPPAIINKAPANLKTEQEKLLLANRERDKGNEAFRATVLHSTLILAFHYRSLSILPTAAAHNNRAQAQINLKHWHKALADCQKVLQLEAGNMKALLRRATVYHHTDKFQLAAADLRTVLREEPHNAAAAQLLSQTEKKMKECQPEKRRKGKKILIEEVQEDDEEPSVKQTGEIV
uniref:Uncharacterized protein n=1 Tax=Mola mola TaxID=94237 RepID=A0A3Q3XDK9_MOLML